MRKEQRTGTRCLRHVLRVREGEEMKLLSWKGSGNLMLRAETGLWGCEPLVSLALPPAVP